MGPAVKGVSHENKQGSKVVLDGCVGRVALTFYSGAILQVTYDIFRDIIF